jgi:hypothetical protein
VTHIVGPSRLLQDLEQLRPRAPAWTTALAPVLETTLHVTPPQIWREGQLYRDVQPPATMLAAVDAAVNAAAVEALSCGYVLIHAGAVAISDAGVLLPAPPGRGKTTLVAGLLASGSQYLSDEVGVLDPATLQVLPFAKCLSMKRGGMRALASVDQGLARRGRRVRSGRETIWYLAPPADAWPARPVTLRYVVVPHYVARARTQLVPLARTTALEHLVQQSHLPPPVAADGMRHLVEVVRRVDCYLLRIGNLRQAVNQLSELCAPRRVEPQKENALASGIASGRTLGRT